MRSGDGCGTLTLTVTHRHSVGVGCRIWQPDRCQMLSIDPAATERAQRGCNECKSNRYRIGRRSSAQSGRSPRVGRVRAGSGAQHGSGFTYAVSIGTVGLALLYTTVIYAQ